MNYLVRSKAFLRSKNYSGLSFAKINMKGFCSNATPKDECVVVNLTKSADLDNIISTSKVPVIVDFYADWCGPCKRLTPVLESNLKEKKNFKLVKINVDDHGELAEKFDVAGIPYVVCYKNGKKAGDFAGFNEDALKKMIASF